jgi:ABC-type branched-subunit amino acid transport system substrate-binding protein
LALLALAVTGCPNRSKRKVMGVPLPTSGDKAALKRFEATQSRFERDGNTDTSSEFEAIVRDFPDDPIVPHALLYAGMAAVRAGEYDKAVENLAKLDEEIDAEKPLLRRGRIYHGIALNYLGHHGAALSNLRSGEKGLNDDDKDEQAEFYAALASANAATGKILEAIDAFDRWFEVARPAERAYVVARVRDMIDKLDDASVRRAYSELDDKDGPAAALLGDRYASELAGLGETARAKRIREDTSDARKRIGLGDQAIAADGGNPDRVGAVLPVTGKRSRVGDRSMRGLAVASGAYGKAGRGIGRDGVPKRFRLAVRDNHSSPADAAASLDELAAEGVIGIVGPIDGAAVDRAAERAARHGVPMISLNPRSSKRASASSFVFHAVHSAEDRARALARYEIDHDIKDFAVLRPDNNYGKAVSKAFIHEIDRLGGNVVVEVDYDPKSTSFKKYVRKLKKPWSGIFIPDQASRLELIAPALAAGNFNAQPAGSKKPKRGRSMVLLSTAEFVTDKYLRSSGRYSWGAVFAPGFYADRRDPATRRFANEYQASFGIAPTALDAYAYDAALAIRATVEDGADTRAAVAAALATGSVRGLTGEIRFDSSRRRADRGVLYMVDRLSDDVFEIRVLREKDPAAPGSNGS